MQDIVNQLNTNNTYASYTLNMPNQIVGSWQQNAQASGALGASAIDLQYKIVVSLNDDKTFTYKEQLPDSSKKASLSLSKGSLSFGGSSSKFGGKTFGMKKMGTTIHPGGSNENNSYTYNLEAEKIKAPLLQALNSSGYQEKKGFLSKIFG